MVTIIRFEDLDVWETFAEAVDDILADAGIGKEDYQEIDIVFPPFKAIPSGTQQLDEESLKRLRDIDGVIVEVENDD